MPLKISHGAFDGMCSEFHDWRCAVAKAAGYPTTMELLDYGHMYERPAFDWDLISDDNIDGVWTTPPAKPLLVLFVHSDAEGAIEPADARRLADALTKLDIPRKWRTVTEKLITACRLAASGNEPIKFCGTRRLRYSKPSKISCAENLADTSNGR